MMFHVIDDLPEVRDILKQLIEYAGYQVEAFDSAESYLNYCHSPEYNAPVAILTDYMMTGMNGLELIHKVRERLPEQKAVIVSGTPNLHLNIGPQPQQYYALDKPYRSETLFALLRALSECEKECGHCNPARSEEHCAYGLDHACPFYSRQNIY